ncbi:DUF6311 domain-containing protein [Paraburkholderia mimosarum]|uniref:DUF6311 domain-containing protein n=1 Tax=Paraburkholderia mimosarum TaxID=312026 RepID=UPI0039C09A56
MEHNKSGLFPGMAINVSASMNTSKADSATKGVDIIVPAVIGLLVFLWFGGSAVLHPTNIGWIMSSAGDPVQHYVGWQSFRHTPLLQWPLGRNWNYGEDLSTSIVFTDSIPLFALIFKPFNIFLPADFQYAGIWLLVCFMLQAIFAWALVRQLLGDRIIAAIAAGIFTFTPAMLLRGLGHEALVGQWIVLAALNVYFSDRRKTLRWTLLLCIASLVHAYLLVIALAVWATDAIRLFAYRLDSRANIVKRVAINSVAVLGTMWTIGYFFPASTATVGFGEYRFDLLSPFNPEEIWSIFYSGKVHGGDYEGFAYLGAGVILLVAIDLYLMLFRKQRVAFDRKKVLPLAILAVCLVIYAASNRVGVYGHTFAYPLPRFTTKLTSTFRASGRFAWPGVYLVILGAIVYFARRVNRNVAIAVLGCALVLQAVDLSKAAGTLRERWGSQWTNPLSSPFWAAALHQYRQIHIVPPTGLSDFNQLAVLGAAKAIPINDGVIARVDDAILAKERSRAAYMIGTRSFDPATLYVFSSNFLWNAAVENAKPTDFVGEVNGYKVYAPNWHGCVSTCGLKPAVAEPYPSGKATSFGTAGDSNDVIIDGWSVMEPSGRWTDADFASLVIYVGKVTNPVRIRFDFAAFTAPSRTQQKIEVLSSGKPIVQWTAGNDEVTKEIVIDPAEIDANRGFVNVTFRLPDSISPQQAGVSSDTHQLGIFMKSMTVNY